MLLQAGKHQQEVSKLKQENAELGEDLEKVVL